MREAPRHGVLAMALIALGNFANFYVFDCLAPLAATLSQQLGFSDSQIGTLGALYSLPNIVLLLFGGLLVDRYGIGRVATWTAGICLAGAALTAASPSFALMAAGRLLFGIGGETYNICTVAAVSRWYPARHTALVMGLTIAMGRVGSVAVDLSPTWAAPAYAAGWQAPLLLATAVALAGFLATWAYAWLEGHRAPPVAARAADAPAPSGGSRPRQLLALLRFDRRYWYLGALCVLWYAAILAFRSTFAIKYLQHAHGYALDVAGQIVSAMFIAAIFATPLFGWLSDRRARQGEWLLAGAALLPAAFAVLQFAPGVDALGTVLLGLSYAVVPAVMYPFLARLVEPRRLGTALGLLWVIQNIGVGGANLAAGALNDAFGASATHPAGYAPMMLFFLGCSLLGLGFAWLLRQSTRARA